MAHQSYVHGLSDCAPLLQVRTPTFPTFPPAFRAAGCGSSLQVQVQISLLPTNKLPLGYTLQFLSLQLLLGDSGQEPQGASSSLPLDEPRLARRAKPHHKPAVTRWAPCFLRSGLCLLQVVPVPLQQYARWFLRSAGLFLPRLSISWASLKRLTWMFWAFAASGQLLLLFCRYLCTNRS